MIDLGIGMVYKVENREILGLKSRDILRRATFTQILHCIIADNKYNRFVRTWRMVKNIYELGGNAVWFTKK